MKLKRAYNLNVNIVHCKMLLQFIYKIDGLARQISDVFSEKAL